jgi:simple sugar transport system substrate-binding protein
MNGETVTDGMDLGLPGYEAVKLDGKVIYGQAWVNVNKANMAEYPF